MSAEYVPIRELARFFRSFFPLSLPANELTRHRDMPCQTGASEHVRGSSRWVAAAREAGAGSDQERRERGYEGQVLAWGARSAHKQALTAATSADPFALVRCVVGCVYGSPDARTHALTGRVHAAKPGATRAKLSRAHSPAHTGPAGHLTPSAFARVRLAVCASRFPALPHRLPQPGCVSASRSPPAPRRGTGKRLRQAEPLAWRRREGGTGLQLPLCGSLGGGTFAKVSGESARGREGSAGERSGSTRLPFRV